MKLAKVQVTNFRSVEDSGVFEIGDMTCLVGKNEAGKTAILKAIHGLDPIDDFSYDRTRDYPRRYLSKFDERHRNGESPVARTWWQLDDADIADLEELLGDGVLNRREIEITSYIGRKGTTWFVPLDEKKCLANLEARHGLTSKDKGILRSAEKSQDALTILKEQQERSAAQEALLQALTKFRDGSAVRAAIDLLAKRKPQLFYTSHFERMSGEVSLNKLASDKQNNSVSIGDRIFLDFLEYAGTTIEELRDATKYEDLVAQCEGASNDITDEIFEFWSQNEALSVKIELNQGRAEDPAPFNSGTVAKVRIENKHHRASVPLSERSAGFVWFFSFLSQFKQLKKNTGKAIILLDEPGLTLHGKAQSDLLRYIESRILPEHQVIYTTHSPFMVPAQRLADVRVVEDVVDYRDPRRPLVKGTKVSADVLSVDKDTLFPLQAHLGYEITQSLFVGKHCLLVEGPSDVVYLQVLSRALQSRGRIGLDNRWTICPTGGLDKVTSFASLFSGNNLNIAVLCDYGSGDKAKVERLRQSQILQSGRVLTATDFTGKSESDVEDFFDAAFYCNLVGRAIGLDGSHALTTEKAVAAANGSPRLVKQVEAFCKTLPADFPEFGHYLPAEFLLRHPEMLDGDSPEVTKSLEQFEIVFKEVNRFLN
ncbi:ATP-dependent nuclease [Thauera sp. WB-2]|uniref:ATP-dependent nuclease n=1 Tax=Thauera sp. WB-2 TaxID=2897772 RepID=UPI0022DE1A95|nr:AAA family ATPase [Thauera sp. WB-2]WBL64302.1 ATP-binding protein [Thauera sp. WB-2]